MILPGDFGIAYLDFDPELWRVPLLRAISDTVPVLVVRPISFRHRYLRQDGETKTPGEQPRQEGPGWYQLEVNSPLPGNRLAGVRGWNQRRLAGAVRRGLDAIGVGHGVVWFVHPSWHPTAELLSDRMTSVYDCNDRYAAYPDVGPLERRRMNRWELGIMSTPGIALAV